MANILAGTREEEEFIIRPGHCLVLCLLQPGSLCETAAKLVEGKTAAIGGL